MELEMKIASVYKRLSANWDDNRYLIFKGGSSSGKTISILQKLTIYALQNSNKRITLSAESVPVIKKTLYADWRAEVYKDLYSDSRYNKSEMVYTFPTGSIFQFVPADDAARWHGMRQDVVYFDELYNIKKDIYFHADIRTKEKIISSFNPTSRFYIADYFNDKNTYVDQSTFKDNPFVAKEIIDALMKRIDTDPNFWTTYGLGEWGSNEGLIFREGTNWNSTKVFTEDYQWRTFGLDFGFTHDPTALLEIRYSDGKLWLKEHLYEVGLINRDIYTRIASIVGRERIYADSAEPKSIEELRRYGLNITGAKKGKDSVKHGLSVLKGYDMRVDEGSLNLIKELRNYSWKKTKDEFEEKPSDIWNHLVDALRYGTEKLRIKRTGKYVVS